MGLFDGIAGAPGRRGTTADLAARFGLPVLLVLDVAGQSQSAAAVLRGFATHDARVRIAGVVLNRVGSERHRALVADAIAPLGIPVLGAVPRDETLALPERHLGLVQAGEHADLSQRLDRLADLAERCLDLDAVIASAAPIASRPETSVPVNAGTQSFCEDGWIPAFAGMTGRNGTLPPPRPAHRAGGGPCASRLRLSASARGLAPRPAPGSCGFLAARRRAAAAGLRLLCWLPGALSGLHAGALRECGIAVSRRTGGSNSAQTRPVHGESAAATWCWAKGWWTPTQRVMPMTATARARHQLRAQRKLHLGYRRSAAFGRQSDRRGGQRHPRARISLREPDLARPRCRADRSHGCARQQARSLRRTARSRDRHLLPRYIAGHSSTTDIKQ